MPPSDQVSSLLDHLSCLLDHLSQCLAVPSDQVSNLLVHLSQSTLCKCTGVVEAKKTWFTVCKCTGVVEYFKLAFFSESFESCDRLVVKLLIDSNHKTLSLLSLKCSFHLAMVHPKKAPNCFSQLSTALSRASDLLKRSGRKPR
jgi:hypothetical protein